MELYRCEEMKENMYMERMSVVKSMICKNGDDYYRLENTGFKKWHFWNIYLGKYLEINSMSAYARILFNYKHGNEGCGDNESREWYKGVCAKAVMLNWNRKKIRFTPAWWSLNDYKRCKKLAIENI